MLTSRLLVTIMALVVTARLNGEGESPEMKPLALGIEIADRGLHPYSEIFDAMFSPADPNVPMPFDSYARRLHDANQHLERIRMQIEELPRNSKLPGALRGYVQALSVTVAKLEQMASILSGVSANTVVYTEVEYKRDFDDLIALDKRYHELAGIANNEFEKALDRFKPSKIFQVEMPNSSPTTEDEFTSAVVKALEILRNKRAAGAWSAMDSRACNAVLQDARAVIAQSRKMGVSEINAQAPGGGDRFQAHLIAGLMMLVEGMSATPKQYDTVVEGEILMQKFAKWISRIDK